MVGLPVQIAPSLLSADFADLRQALIWCEQGPADRVHIDIMDGHFVPNLTLGPAVVRALRPHTKLYLDVHLMVTDPQFWIRPFAEAGADGITFHVETGPDQGALIDEIQAAGLQAGVSLRPGTDIRAVTHLLDKADLVLVMSVEPGFGGQEFQDAALDRIRTLVEFRPARDPRHHFVIQVDGGVTLDNAPALVRAGADILVAGTAVFRAPDPVEAIRQFQQVSKACRVSGN